jgi:death-on-curing protein
MVINVDGNKRIAYVLLRLTLLNEGFDFVASQIDKYEMAISASMGIFDFNQIKDWLITKLIKTNQ